MRPITSGLTGQHPYLTGCVATNQCLTPLSTTVLHRFVFLFMIFMHIFSCRTKFLIVGKCPWWVQPSPPAWLELLKPPEARGVTVVFAIVMIRTIAMIDISNWMGDKTARTIYSITSGIHGARNQYKSDKSWKLSLQIGYKVQVLSAYQHRSCY